MFTENNINFKIPTLLIIFAIIVFPSLNIQRICKQNSYYYYDIIDIYKVMQIYCLIILILICTLILFT